jgi:hypothetical protein
MEIDIIPLININNTQEQFSEINENCIESDDDEEYYLITNRDKIDEGWVKMTKVVII